MVCVGFANVFIQMFGRDLHGINSCFRFSPKENMEAIDRFHNKGLSAYPRFREALREKNPEEIVDDGSIPGNGLGVAGLDNGYFG